MTDKVEMEHCSNCKRDIAKVNFVMHEVHCRRNIVLCENCQEPVPRSELDEHVQEYHAPAVCSLCSESFEVSAIDKHKEEECAKRLVHCHFCELQLPFSDMEGHVSYCGSRTEQCVSCGTFVMIKNQESHKGEECLAVQASAASTVRDAPRRSGASGSVHRSGLDDYDNSFAMTELSRMLHATRTTDNEHSRAVPPSTSTRTISSDRFYGSASVTRTRDNHRSTGDFNASRASGGIEWNNTSSGGNGNSRRRVAPRTFINSTQRQKRTNETRKGPDRNKQTNVPQSGSPAVNGFELDRMLALHLAEDLNGSAGINENSSEGHRPAHSALDFGSHFPNDRGYLELPCEFCGCPFEVSALYDHQLSCDLNPSANGDSLAPSGLSEPSRSQPPPGGDPGTDSHRPSWLVDNHDCPVFNDLTSSDIGASDLIADYDTLLPCEFCNSLFPEDVIIQHQAVCDANVTDSPVALRRNVRRPTRHRSPGLHETGAIGRGPQRRFDDPLAHVEPRSTRPSHLVTQPERKPKQLNVPKISNQSTRNSRPTIDTSFSRALAVDVARSVGPSDGSSASRLERRRRRSATRTTDPPETAKQGPPERDSSSQRLSKDQKSRLNQTRQEDGGSRQHVRSTAATRSRTSSRGNLSVTASGYQPSGVGSLSTNSRNNIRPRNETRTAGRTDRLSGRNPAR